jgi:predicted Zn-dependent protease
MRGGKRAQIALIVLLLLASAGAAYWGGRHIWAACHARTAEEALARRDFRQAADHLRKCLAVSPDNVSWQLRAAQTARRRGEYAEALDHLAAYQRLGGPEDTLVLERKLLVVQQGDLAQADPLMASCEEHPDAPETPQILEAVLQGTDNYLKGTAGHGRPPQVEARARRAVEQWLRLRPAPADQVRGLVWRASLFSAGNDRGKAVADLRRALEIDPDSFDARLGLALKLVQSDPAEAAEHLEALRRRDPDSNEVRFPLALVRRSLGQLDEATQLLEQVVASAPDDFKALLVRGQIALDQQQLPQAEELLRRAWDLAPDEPETNLALGRCLQMMGRAQEARPYEDRFQQIKAQRGRMVTSPATTQ